MRNGSPSRGNTVPAVAGRRLAGGGKSAKLNINMKMRLIETSIETCKFLALLAIVRVSLLPNHNYRFASLHPCREEAGLYFLLPLTILSFILIFFIFSKLDERKRSTVSWGTAMLGIALLSLEVFNLGSYHNLIRFDSLFSRHTNSIVILISGFVIASLFLIRKQKISSLFKHVIGFIVIIVSLVFPYFGDFSRGRLAPLSNYYQIFLIPILVTGCLATIIWTIYFLIKRKKNPSFVPLIDVYEFLFIVIAFTVYFFSLWWCILD